MKTNLYLEGKVAIITGCSGGIGLAIGERLASEGASIVITARDRVKLDAATNVLKAAGAPAVEVVAGILTDPKLPGQLREAADKLGGASLLVNNAGVYPAASLAETTPELVSQVMGCNFDGVVSICREIIPAMAARGGGAVVNISSIGARIALPGMSLYAASKAALEAFSRSIAAEFAPNVRINCVSPGPIATEAAIQMAENDETGATDTVTQGIPLQRRGTPEEVAEAVHFLLTARGGWTTGEVLQVNGGGLMA